MVATARPDAEIITETLSKKGFTRSSRRHQRMASSGFWWALSETQALRRKPARPWKPLVSRIRYCGNTELSPDSLVQLSPRHPAAPRLPEWLRRTSATHFAAVHELKTELRRLNLHTVCESARCPNLHECFNRGAATFMILGNLCTRGCGFCSVPKGSPHKQDFTLDPDEPANVARMAASLNLRYVVITSVNRDDLPDGGSAHFAETVRAVRQALPDARIEVLTPDFCGDLDAVARVLDAGPDVFNHNMETIARLYRRVRPQANYQQSLDVLRFAKRQHAPRFSPSRA